MTRHVRTCGCEVEIEGRGVIFAPCDDEGHRLLGNAYFRAKAELEGVIYTLHVSEGEAAMHLPCGCRWGLKVGELVVFPCSNRAHIDGLLTTGRLYCETFGVEFEVVEGRIQ